jgi:hypothetical protein
VKLEKATYSNIAEMDEHDSVQSSFFLVEKTTAQPTPSSMKITKEVAKAEMAMGKKDLEASTHMQ